MVTMVISELKSISRLKIFRESGPICHNYRAKGYNVHWL